MKKLLAIVLAVMLMVSAVPMGAFTTFATDETSGTTGDCTWKLDGTVLTISGNGAMEDHFPNTTRWPSITEVVIKEGVTYIGNYAFNNCDNLTSVSIPDSVKNIGDGAFNSCDKLVNIDMGNGVATIAYSFAGCTSLESIIIPDSVTTIATHAFYGCSSLKYITIGNGITDIGSYAFSNTAYYNDDNNWKNNVLYIGNYLIAAKEEINGEFNIESGTRIIAQYAFYDCEYLTGVTIPESVIAVGSGAFGYCESLTQIIVDDNNKYLCDIDGILYNKNVDTLIQYPIGKENILYIIPDGVITINPYAFYGSEKLTEILIPNSVTTICNCAFKNCYGLISIIIPDSVTNMGASAFEYCKALKNLIIGNGITRIENNTFYGCYDLINVTVGSSVETIGENAFLHCDDIANIYITDLEAWCNIEFKHWAKPDAENLYLNNELITELIIPDGVTSIGNNFVDFKCFKSVTIPESVTYLGVTFNGCSNIDKITLPNTNNIRIAANTFRYTAYYNDENNWKNGILYIGNHLIKANETISGDLVIEENILTIAADAFRSCANLISVKIPENIIYINDTVFCGCTSLESVNIPNGVTSIGDSAFAFCEGLTNISIPDRVTKIGCSAFDGCSGLTDVIIPNSVTNIDYWAFAFCFGLTKIEIPESVTYIGFDAFLECSELTIYGYKDTCAETYADENDIPFVALGGVISGDTNGDDNINNKDLGLLMQYLNDWEVEISTDAADVNGDGSVNNKDYGLLMQYCNGWDVELQ